MTTAISRLCAVTIPFLLATACGGDSGSLPDLGMPDLSMSAGPPDLVSPPADLTMPTMDLSSPAIDLSSCMPFRLVTGKYAAVGGSAAILADTCGAGLVSTDVESARTLQNDGSGNITVLSSDGAVTIGYGPVRCNMGLLTSGPVTVANGRCQFKATYSVDFTVSADNAFNMVVTQSRAETMTVPGMSCSQPVNCAIKFKVSHRL